MKKVLGICACLLFLCFQAKAQMPDDRPRIDDHFQRWKVHYRLDLKEKMNLHLQPAVNTNYYQNTDKEYNDAGYDQRYGTKAYKYRKGLIDALIRNLINSDGKITKAFETADLTKEIPKDEASEILWKLSGAKESSSSNE